MHRLLRKEIISANCHHRGTAYISSIIILLLSLVTISNLSIWPQILSFTLLSQHMIILEPSQRNEKPWDLELLQWKYIPIHPLFLSFFWSLSHLWSPQRPPIKWSSFISHLMEKTKKQKKPTLYPFQLSTLHYFSPQLHSQTSLKNKLFSLFPLSFTVLLLPMSPPII